MKKLKTVCYMTFATLASIGGNASAAVTAPGTIDFENSWSGTTGVTNKTPAGGTIYTQAGVVVGTVYDPIGATHTHKISGTSTGTQIATVSDSDGIYLRATDNTAFSVNSLDFHSPYKSSGDLNLHTVGGLGDGSATSDYWDIYGYSDGLNPNLLTLNGSTTDTGSGITWGSTDPNQGNPVHAAVAHATVLNGFDGVLNLLSLDPSFSNVSAVWIHYHNYPHSSDFYNDPNTGVDPITGRAGYEYYLQLDNIKVDAAVAAVPVPAAVWMFGSGLLGMLSFGRRKVNKLPL